MSLEKNVTRVKWIGERASFAVSLGNDSNLEASRCPGQQGSRPLFI